MNFGRTRAAVSADVQTGVCFNFLHSHRVFKPVIGSSGKGAACLGLGDDVHDVRVGHRFRFHDDGPVQVLAALGGQVDALLLQEAVDAVEDLNGGLRGGVGADLAAQHFTGGAAHDHDVPRLQACHFI
mgnify:CR=1 FL=1